MKKFKEFFDNMKGTDGLISMKLTQTVLIICVPLESGKTSSQLLKQFKMMTNMMKKMSKGGPKDGMPPEIFNQLK